MPMHYTKKNFIEDIFDTFAINIDCGYTLEPPRREAVHNLCFGTKNKKNRYTPVNPVLLYKSGMEGFIHYTKMFAG